MRISSIKLQDNNLGISIGKRLKGKLEGLGEIVVFTGGNGAGKSRFLRLLKSNYDEYKNDPVNNDVCFRIIKKDAITNKDIELDFTRDMINQFHIINYSHFDAKLQSTVNFSPYVIHQSKNKLKQCNYEETALNSLLYLKDLAEGYSEESNEGNDYKGLVDFFKLTEVVYVSVEYKRKQLETLHTYIDMNGDTVPISQIQLLESQTGKSTVENANNYFYLYYQTNRDGQKLKGEDGVVKKAMKMYFDSLIETSIVR